MVVHLLPTPTARDWKSGASNQHGKNSRPLNEFVVGRLPEPVKYFGTPRTSSANGAGRLDNPKNHTRLETQVVLIPEPDGVVQDWGPYEPAVRRQEAWMGRPAPIPTEVGPRGGRRLAARFAEWLMGLPAGWVTDTPGLSRADQLHAIGNGVVPRQAHAAFSELLRQHEEGK